MTNRILFYLCGWFLGWGGFCSCQHPDGVDPDGRVGQLVADAGITDRQLIKANEFKKEYSEIEWHALIGMRHVLVHGYYQIRDEIVWATIETDLPPLREKVQLILKTL